MTEPDDIWAAYWARKWRDARQAAESGDAASLVALLRGSAPDDETRTWLADLLDAASTSEFAAKIQRRRRGRPVTRSSSALIHAANHVVSNVTAETKLDALLEEAIECTAEMRGGPVALSTLKDYLASHRPDISKALKAGKTKNG